MRKVSCRQWMLLLLSGVWLLIAFLLSGGTELLAGLTPTVLAASQGSAHSDITSVQSECTNEHRGPSFGKAVVVDTNEVVCSNLTSFGGTVAINGEVRGDVVAFGSNLVIVGTVDGNIDLYGGNVLLQSGSHIHGDIHLYGSSWTQGKGTQLDGAVVDHTKHVGWFLPGSDEFSFPLLPILTWIALGLLLTWLLPEHVMLVRTTVLSKMPRSLMIGLLSILLAPPVLVVLIALILSIPLAIIIVLGLIAAWALGTVAIGWILGEYIVRKVAPQYNSRRLQVVVGLTVLVLVGSIPYIGWLISMGAGLLGLGAVFLSRFGTRLYSQPKQPLIL